MAGMTTDTHTTPIAEETQANAYIVVAPTFDEAKTWAYRLTERLELTRVEAFLAKNPPRLSTLVENDSTVYLVGEYTKPTDWLEHFYSWVRNCETVGVTILGERDIWAGRTR